MTLAIVAAYLIGSVPFALLLARRWGAADLRTLGSGNLGAANVLRASGLRAGVIVAVLDVAKGAAAAAQQEPAQIEVVEEPRAPHHEHRDPGARDLGQLDLGLRRDLDRRKKVAEERHH